MSGVALHRNQEEVKVLGQADFSTQVPGLRAERAHFVLQGLPTPWKDFNGV